MWRRLAQCALRELRHVPHSIFAPGGSQQRCLALAASLKQATEGGFKHLLPWQHHQGLRAWQQPAAAHAWPGTGGALFRPPCGVRLFSVPVAERKQLANPALKFWKPTSPGQRFRATIRRDGIWKGRPLARLVRGVNRLAGRNNAGRISVRHRGGGHKKKLRMVDFRRVPPKSAISVEGVVERLEYDPGRTAYIALVNHTPGVPQQQAHYSYILAPQDLAPGDTVCSGTEGVPIKPGNSLLLRHIPVGLPIHNLEIYPGKGAQLCRAAGCMATIVNKRDSHAIVRLPSGEQRLFHLGCRASIGVVSNPQNKNRVIGKAGYNRWRGRRPTVRGVAMNSVDHPHGGNTAGGRPSCSPWGQPCKGFKTRPGYKHSSKWIVSPRPRGKHAGGAA